MAISKIGTNSVATDANALAPANLNSTAQYYSFKNRIINGAFEVWQRGNTSRTFATAANYSADRWTRMGYQDGAHERVSISSPAAGMTSRYAMHVSSATTAEAAGGSRCDLSQKIESVNCYDLANQVVTVSFWVRFSAATLVSSTTAFGNFNAYIKTNTTTTDSSTFSDLGDGQIGLLQLSNGVLPTSWTKYTIVCSACPSGLKNLAVRFEFDNLANTASAGTAWYEIAEVQLEKGSTATSFDYRPYGAELALCQRYYERKYNVANQGYDATSASPLWTVPFKVQKRATPTVTKVGTWTSAVNCSQPNLSTINDDSVLVYVLVTSTGHYNSESGAGSGAAYLDITAEL